MTTTMQDEPEALTGFIANQKIQQWQLQGKIGIRTADDAGSAYINWKQCNDRYELRLNGPLGTGSAILFGDQQQASFDQGEGIITAATPQKLLEQQLGWPIPINDMLFWVRGLPAPNKPFLTNQAQNQFQQAGWQLSYSKTTPINGLQLPYKTVAEYQASKPNVLKVTLISKKWNLTPNCQ